MKGRTLTLLLLVALLLIVVGILLLSDLPLYLRTQVVTGPTTQQHQFSWQPPADFPPGAKQLTLRATDNDGHVTERTVTINVQSFTETGSVEGDTNGDCEVNLTDLVAVRNNFGCDPATGGIDCPDTNGDGKTSLADLIAVRNNFGATCDRPAVPGDLNGDGAVTAADLTIVTANFGKSAADADPRADANNDNAVTAADATVVTSNFGR